jgi:hypothetical protein
VGVASLALSAALAGGAGLGVMSGRLGSSPVDRLWTLVFVGAAAGIGVLFPIGRGRFLLAGSLAAAVTLFVLAMIGSGAVAAVLTLIWMLTAALGLGELVLWAVARRLTMGPLARLLLAWVLGLGAESLLTLGLGSLGWLRPAATWILFSALALPGLLRACRAGFPQWIAALKELPGRWKTADLRLTALASGMVLVCLAGAMVRAFAPATSFDALTYHLGVPAIYAREHRVVEVPEEFRSYWAQNAEMLYTEALTLADQPLPALIHFFYGLLTAGLVFATGRKLGGFRVGLFASVLFSAVPFVAWECGTAYIDMAGCACVGAALYAAASWWLGEPDQWLTVLGLAAGLALGTKLNTGMLLLPLLAAVVLGAAIRGKSVRGFAAGALRVGVPMMLVWAPWLLRNWCWTGNPVFPFCNAVFRSPKWALTNDLGFNPSGRGRSFWSVLLLPWNLTRYAGEFVEGPTGNLGSIALMGLPWAFGLYPTRLRRAAIPLIVVVTAAVTIWFEMAQYIRFLLPVVPVMVLVPAFNVESVWLHAKGGRWRKPLLGLGALAGVSLTICSGLVQTAWGGLHAERFPCRVSFGLESRDSYLARSLPVYGALRRLDRQAPDGAQVLSIGNEFRLYTKARIFGVFGAAAALRDAGVRGTEAELARYLEERGYRYLLVDRASMKAHPWMRDLAILNDSFLRAHAELVFTARDVSLYRLRRRATPPG